MPLIFAPTLCFVCISTFAAAIQMDKPFSLVVQEQFASWDLNHDGQLEAAEIDSLMNRRSIEGETAAALAAIKSHERGTTAAQRKEFAISLNQLANISAKSEELKPADTAAGRTERFNYNLHYQQNLRMLANRAKTLFAGQLPNFQELKQGPIGDCYFFSVTGFVAFRHPERIRQMIIPQQNGNFAVRFHDGELIHVPVPTEAEMLVNNSGSTLRDGFWIVVLEKAVGERARARTKSVAKKTAEATDAMAHGGSTATIIELYSGHRVQSVKLRTEANAGEKIASLRREIPQALAAGRIVTVTMSKNPPSGQKKVPDLGYGHAYAIMGYDRQTDHILVWNPWGQNFQPKGPEGLTHGFKAEHGLMRIPMPMLYHQFSQVEFETGLPFGEQARNSR